MNIVQFDYKSAQTLRQLVEFLGPHEIHALFVLGNALNPSQPCTLYGALENGRVFGVCGYYPNFRSCSLYATKERASRALVTHAAARNTVDFLVGTESVIQPALDELLATGRKLLKPPQHDFYELDIEKGFRSAKCPRGKIRLLEERDVDQAIRLLRYLHEESQEPPIREEERQQMRANPYTYGLELDGKIVSIASTNGLALEAFQILGVVTDPLFRRRGFAKAVCSHLIATMRDRGAKKAVLFTTPDNAAARKCYLDLGFVITGQYDVAVFESQK